LSTENGRNENEVVQDAIGINSVALMSEKATILAGNVSEAGPCRC